jgi:hypothetical protein
MIRDDAKLRNDLYLTLDLTLDLNLASENCDSSTRRRFRAGRISTNLSTCEMLFNLFAE